MSFDNNSWARWICHTVSIPFEQGNVFRLNHHENFVKAIESQSLSNRAMSFDDLATSTVTALATSQSLSSRAMSFDMVRVKTQLSVLCLNPFRAGQCLSTNGSRVVSQLSKASQSLSNRAMSFDNKMRYAIINKKYGVSIPFEQGYVFRLSCLR